MSCDQKLLSPWIHPGHQALNHREEDHLKKLSLQSLKKLMFTLPSKVKGNLSPLSLLKNKKVPQSQKRLEFSLRKIKTYPKWPHQDHPKSYQSSQTPFSSLSKRGRSTDLTWVWSKEKINQINLNPQKFSNSVWPGKDYLKTTCKLMHNKSPALFRIKGPYLQREEVFKSESQAKLRTPQGNKFDLKTM